MSKVFRKQKVAIVSGVTGQDGSYLAEILLRKGYFVVGLKRRTSVIATSRIDHLLSNSNFKLEYWSLFDPTATYALVNEYQPDEVYNMAAQSHVAVSFRTPIETVQGITLGTLYWLEAISELRPECKFYQASSSEMYGRNLDVPLSEESVMLPASPYACAKLASHHLVQNYRASRGLHASSGILFNHESERRGETFVTRKVTKAVARIKLGVQEKLVVGNLEAMRDWGHAQDYMRCVWSILQQEEADDYVIATGETHSVREWIETVFEIAELPITWEGSGVKEKGVSSDGRILVEVSSKYFRPQEVPTLLGDSSKAKEKLGWEPKITFKTLAKMMYSYDLGEAIEARGGVVESMFHD